MIQRTRADWPTCDQAGCFGVRLNATRMCLAHGTEEERAAALKLISESGTIDARGTPITPALLEQILRATSRGANGHPLIRACQFDQATFTGGARFGRVTFNGEAWFEKVTFNGGACFDRATFNGGARFYRATFNGDAGFYHGIGELVLCSRVRRRVCECPI
jgi:Pentapeptide repeats (9 copies)